MFRWFSIAILFTAVGRADADAPSSFEFGARLGAQSTSLQFSDDAPEGVGPLIDLSAGWRISPRFSASLYAAYSSIHDSSIQDPFAAKTHQEDVTFMEVGPRLSFHHRGILAGFGLARQHISYSGDMGFPAFSEWGTMFSVHAGYTFPRIDALGGGAIQLLAIAGMGSTSVEGDTVETLRLGAGIEF